MKLLQASTHDTNKFLQNHAAWFATIADATMPSEAISGFSATVANGHGHMTISSSQPLSRDAVESGLSWMREQSAQRLLIWTDQDNSDLDIQLASRGLGKGFQPRWMLRDLAQPLSELAVPESIVIERATVSDLDALSTVSHIPYVDPDLARKVLKPEYADSVWVLLARDGESGPIVAHVTLFLPNDGSGWGGVYGAGVQIDRQRRGIGSALTLTACSTARNAGFTHLSLNATPDGERAYRKAGFVVVGDGQTWFMELNSDDPGPNRTTVELAERLARGNQTDSDRLLAISATMPNGDSPLAFAARFDQTNAALWLIELGAVREIPALAHLKLWSELEAALDDPGLVNALIGSHGRTPLHQAVLDNDRKLVVMLLEAGADISILDGEFASTALGWANHLGRLELARMIEKAAEMH